MFMINRIDLIIITTIIIYMNRYINSRVKTKGVQFPAILERIGRAPMLETPQKRARLLKAGIDGKTIEKLYIIYNNFKIVNIPLLFELVEINVEENKNSTIIHEAK
jgi:hypothetical protein